MSCDSTCAAGCPPVGCSVPCCRAAPGALRAAGRGSPTPGQTRAQAPGHMEGALRGLPANTPQAAFAEVRRWGPPSPAWVSAPGSWPSPPAPGPRSMCARPRGHPHPLRCLWRAPGCALSPRSPGPSWPRSDHMWSQLLAADCSASPTRQPLLPCAHTFDLGGQSGCREPREPRRLWPHVQDRAADASRWPAGAAPSVPHVPDVYLVFLKLFGFVLNFSFSFGGLFLFFFFCQNRRSGQKIGSVGPTPSPARAAGGSVVGADGRHCPTCPS